MIRTVTGNIQKTDVGNVLMHEHIQCASNDLLHSFGYKWIDEGTVCYRAIEVLKRAKEKYGLAVFVDGTSLDLGRNAALLREVSEESGVYIVASAGLYHFPSMISQERSADDLYELLMQEINEGLDGTDVKPGILKCAVDTDGMTFDARKRIRAVGMAQAATGLPLYAHCAHTGDTAFELSELLEESGANVGKVVIGHASRRMEPEYLKRVLDSGAYICIDQSFVGSERQVAQVVYELCKAGYGGKILFSHDMPIRNDFLPRCREVGSVSVENSLKRLSYLYELLMPELVRLGCTDEQITRFLSGNALDVLNV